MGGAFESCVDYPAWGVKATKLNFPEMRKIMVFHSLGVSARLSFGGLEQPLIASMKPLIGRDLVKLTMPSK
jgi:hypothetical protein